MAFKFSSLQSLGRALMLPIAMLPVAGLLLRFGQADLLNIAAIADAGNAIFANLPLLFAIGIAVGFAKDNHGSAGLAGAVGYLILVAMLKSINSEIDAGVLGGILIGSIAGAMYNRYKDIKLPEFLAFFGGKRFIPIITGVLAVILGMLMGYIWPPIQNVLHVFSLWMSESAEVGMFLYGFFNRLLLVTGLHHVLNSLFWFQLGDFTTSSGQVVHGDIARFMAGDPSAGHFMAGYFPIMMFGLPAICLAIYHSAFKENKAAVAGLLLSMALTSFLTGVTEPIEYSFVFLAPLLYLLHALLTGLSMALLYWLNVRLGFSFSAGAIDYALFFKLAQNPLYALALGGAMFVIYYSATVFFIRKFNLPTIGRETADEKEATQLVALSASSIEMQYITALGGADNLVRVDACTTRLRLVVKDSSLINKPVLKALGAKGFVSPAPDSVQVILGPQAEIIATSIRDTLATLAKASLAPQVILAPKLPSQTRVLQTRVLQTRVLQTRVSPTVVSQTPGSNHEDLVQAGNIITGLGGVDNLISVNLIAMTRVKIEIKDEALLDVAKIKNSGVPAMVIINSKIKQLYFGANAAPMAAALKQLLN